LTPSPQLLEQFVAVLADSLALRLADELAPRIAAEMARQAAPFVTVDEAAGYLRCDRQRIYDLLSSGRLTRHKDGTRVLVSRMELEAYVNANGHGGRRVARQTNVRSGMRSRARSLPRSCPRKRGAAPGAERPNGRRSDSQAVRSAASGPDEEAAARPTFERPLDTRAVRGRAARSAAGSHRVVSSARPNCARRRMPARSRSRP
jgi:excisionase family DNA binding protein